MTSGQRAFFIVTGIILILPGCCSLVAMAQLTSLYGSGALNTGLGGIWTLTFLLAVAGGMMVRAAMKYPDTPADAGPSQPPEHATPPDPQSGSGEDQA